MAQDLADSAPSHAQEIRLRVNGKSLQVAVEPRHRLTEVLREQLGLTGTKVGCDAGDCGACTVLLDGDAVCACMVPAGRLDGCEVETVEGLTAGEQLSHLQVAFQRHGAAQCGICTPGMLMAATGLLRQNRQPARAQVEDALGGVLCRCTGYLKIVEAVLAAGKSLAAGSPPAAGELPPAGSAVGAPLPRVDGLDKVTGREIFGADNRPEGALWLRAVRSPHARAKFTLGNCSDLLARYPGLVRVLTARDVPGRNGYGVYPDIKDQPVLAEGHVRYRGEAVLALVGDRETIYRIADGELPIQWIPETPVIGLDGALAQGAPQLHPDYPGNILCEGHVERGDLGTAFASCDVTASGEWETSPVEHGYVEPEAGFARRIGDRIEITACTQTPFMDRDEIASVLGLAADRVRVVPTGIGGGFGGKLDLSLQPLISMAAWLLDRPVRCVYSRPESMAATTKRHGARMRAKFGASKAGDLLAVEFEGDFNTGAYASWGPTVATRVPIHACGPYRVSAVRAHTRAIYTNETPAGAFRGFGTPQAAMAHEGLMDQLAEQLGMDRLEFRLRNALRKGDKTATGQLLTASAGLAECLERLEPHWRRGLEEVERFNSQSGALRQGIGIACMWYGIGNTSLSNPSTIRVGVSRDGAVVMLNGAVDIGQGSSTILAQICADALGAPVDVLRQVVGDTDVTADAGKTSASRQTFVSGKAAQLAGRDLRNKLLDLVGAPAEAVLEFTGGAVSATWEGNSRVLPLEGLPPAPEMEGLERGAMPDLVVVGSGTFDPPTTPQDSQGQGTPYATYGFAAQTARVEVDLELGSVRVLHMAAAHDVGRAINPIQVEGQIHGGIAQGLGMALMEEFIQGRTENLHDYLMPTCGDMPEIDVILIEDEEPLAPFGAKGVGEPALVPAAPAIVGAIRHATGALITRLPATPERVRRAIVKAGREDE